MPSDDRLRRRGLAEAKLPVEDREHRRIDDALHRLVGEERAVLFPFHITRHARDAVAVMAGEVCADQIFSDPSAFLRRAAGGDEDVGDEMLQRIGGDARHISVSSTIGLRRMPMPSISISQTSPSFIQTGGLRACPTPDGVPVTTRSPGSSVIADREVSERLGHREHHVVGIVGLHDLAVERGTRS